LIREKLQAYVMKLLPVTSQAQIADFLTKALVPQDFHTLLFKSGLVDIYHLQLMGVLEILLGIIFYLIEILIKYILLFYDRL